MGQDSQQMDSEDLEQNLTEALCDALQGQYLTVENIAKYLLKSKLIQPNRLQQYLALKEFYDRYHDQSKSSLIHQVSAKYDISTRTMWDLIHERRFVI